MRDKVRDEEVAHDLPPARWVPCCQRSDNHPGCRDEKKLDENVVYGHYL
jgi:hypothetical protein